MSASETFRAELVAELRAMPITAPPRLDAPGEFAILAARSFDIPFSFSFSYCFSFLTLARLFGISTPPSSFYALVPASHMMKTTAESRIPM